MSDLKPCPFCGNTEPWLERIGTPRWSCIVACGECGSRHESSDEGADSGASWNRRAQPEPAEAVPQREAFEVEFAKLGYQWSDSNKDKAFLGWSLAVERAPKPAEAVLRSRST